MRRLLDWIDSHKTERRVVVVVGIVGLAMALGTEVYDRWLSSDYVRPAAPGASVLTIPPTKEPANQNWEFHSNGRFGAYTVKPLRAGEVKIRPLVITCLLQSKEIALGLPLIAETGPMKSTIAKMEEGGNPVSLLFVLSDGTNRTIRFTLSQRENSSTDYELSMNSVIGSKSADLQNGTELVRELLSRDVELSVRYRDQGLFSGVESSGLQYLESQNGELADCL